MNTWEERENKEAHAKDEKRKEQIQKVIWKKNEFQNKQEIKKKNKLITDMLEKLSKVAAQKIEEDMRKEERMELQVMKRNIWKRWRGKNGIKERKAKIPTELEKVEKKLEDISHMIKQY